MSINSHIFCLFILWCIGFASTLEEDFNESEADETGDTSRMWRGNRTTYRRHPYFAAITLFHLFYYARACGGAFVTPQAVVTAAHCVDDVSASSIRATYGLNVIVGTWGSSAKWGSGFDHKVASIHMHPDFVLPDKVKVTTDEFADIALLILKEPIQHKSIVVRLPEPEEDKAFVDTERTATFVAAGLSFGGDADLTLKEATIRLYRHVWRRKWVCIRRNESEFAQLRMCADADFTGYRSCEGMFLSDKHGSIIFFFIR